MRKNIWVFVVVVTFIGLAFGPLMSSATTIECEAEVTPDQPWSEDGTATVTLKSSCNVEDTRTLPLKHFPPRQEITIEREDYPLGLVVVPTEGYPEMSLVTLPAKISSDDTIILRRDQDWPDGGVGIFIEM